MIEMRYVGTPEGGIGAKGGYKFLLKKELEDISFDRKIGQ
jgi:hypothetical protein